MVLVVVVVVVLNSELKIMIKMIDSEDSDDHVEDDEDVNDGNYDDDDGHGGNDHGAAYKL